MSSIIDQDKHTNRNYSCFRVFYFWFPSTFFPTLKNTKSWWNVRSTSFPKETTAKIIVRRRSEEEHKTQKTFYLSITRALKHVLAAGVNTVLHWWAEMIKMVQWKWIDTHLSGGLIQGQPKVIKLNIFSAFFESLWNVHKQNFTLILSATPKLLGQNIIKNYRL